MKKLFISLVAVAFSLSAMAASTAAARIKLVGSNATYAVSTLYLNEDDARNSSYESGYDAESMMSQSNPFSVLIYAYVGEHSCEFVATDNLDGQEIAFTTNMIDADYTLQFTNVSGRALNLYDRLLDVTTPIVEGESYNFSVDGSLVGQHAVSGRFYINMEAADFNTVTTNAYGFCSFASSEAVEFQGGVKAYKGAFNSSTFELTLTEVGTKVPANTGVILWKSGVANETFNYTTGVDASSADVTGNDFVGAVADKPVAEVSADAIYCLHGNELMKLGDGVVNIPAGKAYLPVSAAPGAPKRIVMRFNTTTAIDNVEMESIKAEKFVENGQIFIRRGNEVFNLQGQIVK